MTPDDLAVLGSPARRRLALEEDLDPEIQLALAKDGDAYVRSFLALNSGTTPAVQLVLACDSADGIRADLAENPALAPEVQRLLALDPNEEVRHSLAESRVLVPEVHRALADDSSSYVLKSLAANWSVIPTTDYPMSYFELSAWGPSFLAARFKESGLDLEDLERLRSGWTGTLSELLETAEELSAAPA
jgi:hypothetical protein